MSGVEIEVPHRGCPQLRLLSLHHFELLVRKSFAPVEVAALTAPAHRCRDRRAYSSAAEAVVHRRVDMDAVFASVFEDVILLPGLAPGAFRDICLICRLRSQHAEFHLSRIVGPPLAVGLVGPQLNRVAVRPGSCGHPGAALPAVSDHSLLYRIASRLAFGLNGRAAEKCEHHRLVLDLQFCHLYFPSFSASASLSSIACAAIFPSPTALVIWYGLPVQSPAA